MTAIWAPSGLKGQIPRAPADASAAEPTGRQVVDQSLASSWMTAIRRLSGLNLAESPCTGPGSFKATALPVDVPDREGESGKMRGRQVAAVGAEAEDEDLAIAPGLEAGDLPDRRRRS